jgi:hypothetical protein
MEGDPDDEVNRGIMPNSFVHIFDAVKGMPASVEFLVRASFLEIYLEDVFDLLNKDARAKMEVKGQSRAGYRFAGRRVRSLATYRCASLVAACREQRQRYFCERFEYICGQVCSRSHESAEAWQNGTQSGR